MCSARFVKPSLNAVKIIGHQWLELTFLSLGTQAEEARRIQTYCGVSLQASDHASAHIQLPRPYCGWCLCGGRCREGRYPNNHSKPGGEYCALDNTSLKVL